MSKEFLMWEHKEEKFHTQCTWKDGIYSVIVKIGNTTKAATWNQFEKPKFANISLEDKNMSAVLTKKLVEEIKSEQEK